MSSGSASRPTPANLALANPIRSIISQWGSRPSREANQQAESPDGARPLSGRVGGIAQPPLIRLSQRVMKPGGGIPYRWTNVFRSGLSLPDRDDQGSKASRRRLLGAQGSNPSINISLTRVAGACRRVRS